MPRFRRVHGADRRFSIKCVYMDILEAILYWLVTNSGGHSSRVVADPNHCGYKSELNLDSGMQRYLQSMQVFILAGHLWLI